MYDIYFSVHFKKKYRKLVRGDNALKRRIVRSFDIMRGDPFYVSLRTHKINSSVHGTMYSSRVTSDIRILWDFSKDNNIAYIVAVDIGGHDVVYR